MVVESAQLLCTVAHKQGIVGAPYRLTHKNHPCVLWIERSMQNWLWALEHSFGLSSEYTYRYDKHHKSANAIRWASKYIPDLPNVGLTPFAQCMPDTFKNIDAVIAYRSYYLAEKARFARWNKTRKCPNWWPVAQSG